MRIIAVTSFFISSLAFAAPTTQPVSYGAPMTIAEDQTVDIAKVLAEPAKYDGQTLRIRGTIKEVCKSMGCWIKVGGGESKETLFVSFSCPIEGKLIPGDALSKTVVVEGVLKVAEISQDTARHYAEDAGASKEEIDAIKGPQKQVKIASPGARVE